jgi:16S rRNA (uracil1498-N3)-methyltransferase
MQPRSIAASYNPAVHVPRFFAPDAQSQNPIPLSEEESRHLARVLRMRSGDPALVFDGKGGQWHARVAAVGTRVATLERRDASPAAAEPAVRVTLASALLKGDQMDDVVRDATMMGVAAIVPIVTMHVVVPERAWRDGSPVERWRRVALASAKQCGRAVVPALLPVTPYEAIWTGTGHDIAIICAEPSLARSVTDRGDGSRPASALVCVGPEGGWTEDELAVADRHHAQRLSLGPRTLRASSAPIVALSALWSRWGWAGADV